MQNTEPLTGELKITWRARVLGFEPAVREEGRSGIHEDLLRSAVEQLAGTNNTRRLSRIILRTALTQELF